MVSALEPAPRERAGWRRVVRLVVAAAVLVVMIFLTVAVGDWIARAIVDDMLGGRPHERDVAYVALAAFVVAFGVIGGYVLGTITGQESGYRPRRVAGMVGLLALGIVAATAYLRPLTWPTYLVSGVGVSVDGAAFTGGQCYTHADTQAFWFLESGRAISGDELGGKGASIGLWRPGDGSNRDLAVGDPIDVHILYIDVALGLPRTTGDWRGEFQVAAVTTSGAEAVARGSETGQARDISWTCSPWRAVRMPDGSVTAPE
jgi:hypothetical protein